LPGHCGCARYFTFRLYAHARDAVSNARFSASLATTSRLLIWKLVAFLSLLEIAAASAAKVARAGVFACFLFTLRLLSISASLA